MARYSGPSSPSPESRVSEWAGPGEAGSVRAMWGTAAEGRGGVTPLSPSPPDPDTHPQGAPGALADGMGEQEESFSQCFFEETSSMFYSNRISLHNQVGVDSVTSKANTREFRHQGKQLIEGR